MLLEGFSTEDDAEDEDLEGDERLVEDGLLCADFQFADVSRGYSMRMITTRATAEIWEKLPPGASLAVIADCEHGTSFLPVSRRLDSQSLPGFHETPPGQPPLPPLSHGVSRSFADVKYALRCEAMAGTPELDPSRDRRDSKNVWPEPLLIKGDDFWPGSRDEDLITLIHPRVQAFCLSASCPGLC